MRVKIERVLFISLFFVFGNLVVNAQTAPVSTDSGTGLQSIFGNLNIDAAKQADVDFENSKKNPQDVVNPPLIDTHEDQKTVVKFETRENKFWNKGVGSTTNATSTDIGNSKDFFKLKKDFKGNVDVKKLKAKLEKIKNKKYSTGLQTSLNNFKTKRKTRKSQKTETQAQAVADQQMDFDTLKNLNAQIQADTDAAVKTDLTGDEQNAVDKVEGNILFQQDDIYLPNDISNTINSVTDWAIPAIVSDNPNIFSTAPTLNRSVVVAVIDSGVDYTHEELKNSMWSSPNCVDENNQNIVGGCINGYDFVDNDKDPYPVDGVDHGTAVSTLIAASTDNGKGIASLSQNRAKIMALRVADNSNLISLDSLTRAVYFAVNNGADVINMSLSGPTFSQSLYDALSYAKDKGVIVVVSSGNSGKDLEMTKFYPASYDMPNIYVVGSLDNNGAISSFSNYGVKTVDVLAPGRDVLAGTLGNSYSLHSGTSFSAPIFSALVARWISEGKTVSEEYLGLKSNATFSNYVIKGKTLALSNSNVTSTFNSTQRYQLLPNGMYLDNMSKGGMDVVNANQTTQLATANDTRISSPTNSLPTDGSVLNSTTVTFSWTSVSGAGTYGVYLTDVTYGQTLETGATRVLYAQADNLGVFTSYKYSDLTVGHKYKWNVSARVNSASTLYNYSAATYFSVTGGGSAPASPVPSSPISASSPGSYISGNSVTLSWSQVPGAKGYKVTFFRTDGSVLTTVSYTTTSANYSIAPGGTYYWYVQATNDAGDSVNSLGNYFNTIATSANQPPSIPTISGPTSVGVNTTQSYNFVSTDPEGSAVTYDVIWDNTDNPGNVITIGQGNSGATFPQAKSFSSVKTYCVKARARDTSGALNNASAYSPCYNVNVTGVNKPDLVFSTISAPLTTFTPGQPFSQSINVYNQGNVSTANSFHVTVFLNNVSYPVGQATVSQNITAGGSAALNIPITLPPSSSAIFSGSNIYYLVFRVDDQSQVDESNESNNDYSTNIVINNNATVGKSFTIGTVAQQTAGQLMTVTLNLNGFTQNTTAYVYADGNSLDRNSFPITGGATTAQFNIKITNANSLQNLKVLIDNQTQLSNYFKVLTNPNAPVVPQITNAGSITVNVRNFGNQVVSNATVDICGDICDATKVTKTTDTSGNVFFSLSEISAMPSIKKIQATKGNFASRRISFTYSASSPNYENIQTVTTVNDVFHNPVILVPGISGSTYANDNKVIPVVGEKLSTNGLKIADGTGDLGNVSNLPGLSVGKLGWEDLRKDLESVGYVRDQTIIDCPYDWRISNDITADTYFASCIQKAVDAEIAMGKNPGSYKIDVIAHSMGGLVTRAYIQKNNGVNANKIGKIAFMGTPQQGASTAYKIWEGGESKDLVTNLIFARVMQNTNTSINSNFDLIDLIKSISNNGVVTWTIDGVTKTYSATEFGYYLYKTYNDQLYTKSFVQKNALAVKQLLPTYPFLTSVGTLSNVPISNSNQNEFLLALNGQNCGDSDGCNEGKSGGGNYSYKDLKQTLIDSGILAKMFYGQANTDDTDYQYLVDTANTGFYNDGKVLSTSYSAGDQTVPMISTKTFSDNNLIASVQTSALHSKLPSAFAKQVTEWVSGQTVPNLASLQAVGATSHLNITLGAGVSAYLQAPNGKTLGINPSGNVAENTIGSDANATIDGNGVTFAIDNPTVGNYKLFVDGGDKLNYSFYSEFDDTNHKDVVMGTRFHQGSEEGITFSLTGSADANAKGLQYDKIESVPQNIVVSNNGGNTKISWTTSLDSSVTKYRIYSKNPAENNFAQIGETTGNSFNTTDIFAGALETYTKDYRVSQVFSDGTESNMTLDYYNNDTDWDGLTDTQEAQYNTLLNKIDTDGDGLPDGVEVNITGTDPTKADTDGNGIDDYNDNKAKFNLKDKVVAPVANSTIFSENFDRANSSTIGGNFVDGSDLNDNLQIVNNKLQMKWVSQVWGNFHNLYSPLQKQNDIKISYTWRVQSGATVDGYLPFIGVRGGGTGTNDVNGSYGAALYYMGQNDSVNVHILDKGILKANITNVITAPAKDTDYSVEIKITNQNFIEVRIWKTGTAYPTNPQASWNNGNVTYTPVANGNNLVLTALHGSGNPNSVNASMDDLKIDSLSATNNPPLITLNGSSTISVIKGSVFTDLGATASDPEEGDLTSKIILSGNVDMTKLGPNTLTYSVSDSKFATSTITRTVNVVADPGLLNLISYLKLNYSTTTNSFADEMLNNNNATITPSSISPGWGMDRIGNASSSLYFNSQSRVDFSPVSMQSNTSRTYSIWFKTANSSSDQVFVNVPFSYPVNAFQFGTSLGNPFVTFQWVAAVGSGTDSASGIASGKSYADNGWHKMDVVLDNSGTAAISKIYIDGVIAKTNQAAGKLNFTSTACTNINIGGVASCGSATTTVNMNGNLDDFKIYNRALSPSELLGEYQKDILGMNNNTTPVNLPVPIANSKFDGAIGIASKVKDAIRNTVSVLDYAGTISDKDHVGTVDGSYTTNSSSYLRLDNPKTITTDSQTYSFWVKSTTIMNSALMSFNSNNGTQNYFSLWISQGKLYPELNWKGGTPGGLVGNYPTKNIVDGKWHKIDVALANNPNATVNVYIDGILDNSATGGSPYNFQSIDNEIFLGIVRNWQSRSIESYRYPASFDDFKLYDKALSVTDISNIYNSEKTIMASLQFSLASAGDEPTPEIQTINNILNEGDTCAFIFSCNSQPTTSSADAQTNSDSTQPADSDATQTGNINSVTNPTLATPPNPSIDNSAEQNSAGTQNQNVDNSAQQDSTQVVN